MQGMKLQKRKKISFLNSPDGKRIVEKIRGVKYTKKDAMFNGKDVGDAVVKALREHTTSQNKG